MKSRSSFLLSFKARAVDIIRRRRCSFGMKVSALPTQAQVINISDDGGHGRVAGF